MKNELLKKRFTFAVIILAAMLSGIALAVLGANEVFVVLTLCVCVILVVIHDIFGRKLDGKSEMEEEFDVIDLDDFFKKGGIAYCWNKGDKEKRKYHTIDELFDGDVTDYAELWLGNTRYYIKDTGNEKDM